MCIATIRDLLFTIDYWFTHYNSHMLIDTFGYGKWACAII